MIPNQFALAEVHEMQGSMRCLVGVYGVLSQCHKKDAAGIVRHVNECESAKLPPVVGMDVAKKHYHYAAMYDGFIKKINDEIEKEKSDEI